MKHCHSCSGGCCGLPSSEILLCSEEVALLMVLAQYAFLPVVQTIENEKLRYILLNDDSKQCSEVIAALEAKKLITVDADLPITNVDYGMFQSNVNMRCGSLGLTKQGQEVIDWLVPEEFGIYVK